jgi:protein SCO1
MRHVLAGLAAAGFMSAVVSTQDAPRAVPIDERRVVTSPGNGFDLPSIPDVGLIDQNGRPRRFRSDLIKGKVVAINAIFTTCTTVCPPMGVTFAKLQQQLGTGASGRVALISISVDPLTDTPSRLKAWAEQFGAGPEWTLVTGDKPDIDRLLKALGMFTADRWDHAPTTLIGSEPHGRWTRATGFNSPSRLAALIAGFLDSP